jgi:peroxiredoxin
VRIVGVSFDSPSKNQSWAEGEGFTFELWTDSDRTLALYYGAASSEDQLYAERLTKILDAEGTLVLEYSVTSIPSHPANVLEDCIALFGG